MWAWKTDIPEILQNLKSERKRKEKSYVIRAIWEGEVKFHNSESNVGNTFESKIGKKMEIRFDKSNVGGGGKII